MPLDKDKNISGLPGLNRISEEERQAFMLNNAEKLKKFAHQPKLKEQAADMLYNNALFVKTFGKEAFDKLNNGTQEAYDYRNSLLRDNAIKEQWDALYNPAKTEGKGLGEEYKKYNELSVDSKLKMLESDYLTPSEFEESLNNGKVQAIRQAAWTNAALGSMSPTNAMIAMQQGFQAPGASAIPTPEEEAPKQFSKKANDRILEHIYSEEADNKAKELTPQVDAFYSSPSITQQTDDQIQKLFKTEITPNSYKGNQGIPEFAKFYIENPDNGAEEGEFTVDDMRKILSMKKVYEANLSPEMARTALENYAKRFNKDHQSFGERAKILGKDILISSASYTVDKVNGIYNVGLMIADEVSEKPVVWVDDDGNILANNDPRLTKNENGQVIYQDDNGNSHYVHKEEVSRTTLHNLGKNFDGSDNRGIFNPQDWSDREQFGVWDTDLAKEYKNINASPYKVAYDPGKDSDLWYEAFKMTSFALADGMAQLIPYGIGMAGRTLGVASDASKVVRGLGKGLDYAGRALTYQSKFGQIAQGTLGAAGIAYAYQRGSFAETLANNLAEVDKSVLERSNNEVLEEYQNNPVYKAQMDAIIDARTEAAKAERIAQLGPEGAQQIINSEQFDSTIRNAVSSEVLREAALDKANALKGTNNYALLQEQAIREAGATANRTFLPEAVKYGLVNTLGYRKFLYTNPTGITKPVSSTLKGLKEITTAEGRKRLTTETSKFLTNKDKWTQLGKTAGRMYWGGAWTNGSDDMMVDAAERINQDSFSRYTNGFTQGEAISDIAGYTDGLYSYINGLYNSLGQRTTWQAANVGGLGSTITFTPNFANIASLATKSGREAFKNNYQQRVLRNEDGTIKKDANGAPVTESIDWKENWRDRAGFFLQNGVLNEYYGAKQTERDLQNHADYVNKILDDYEDFESIEDFITSDIGLSNAESISDKKTMQFINALSAMNMLNRLAQDKNDPTVMSSVVDNARSLIERAANMKFDDSEGAFSEEEANNLVAEYYAKNDYLARSEYNSQKALYDISQNAQILLDASDALDNAEKEIQKIEKNIGIPISTSVRNRMKRNIALNAHWNNRIQEMKEDIDDGSLMASIQMEDDVLLASVGGRKNANGLLKVYEKQQIEFIKDLDSQRKDVQEKLHKKEEAEVLLKVAQREDKNVYVATKLYNDAVAALEESQLQEAFIKEEMATSLDKQHRIEQILKTPVEEGSQERVLTADEIFGLDPITRARMLNPTNRHLYSESQEHEINNLEKRLLMRDGDALQKVQDIALLTQRVASNEDAYSRMAKNPEAAAVQIEAQREQAALVAYDLVNENAAKTLVSVINEYDTYADNYNISQADREDYVFKLLSKNNPQTLLSIINEEKLLPKYQKQVTDAINYTSTLSDLVSIIRNADKTSEWKDNISREIDKIVSTARSREDIMTKLESIRTDVADPEVVLDFEYILSSLEKLGYQRDATVIESRKQKEERQDEVNKKKEELKRKSEEEAQAAMAKAQAEEQEKWEAAQAQPAQVISEDGSNALSFDVPPIDQGEETAIQQGELSEPLDFVEETESKNLETNEEKIPASDVNVAEQLIVDDAESIQGKSPTIDEQIADSTPSDKEIHSSEETSDVSNVNGTGEYSIDNAPSTLSGNAMSEWNPNALQNEGILEHKKGEKEGDSMNRYFDWMDNAGIKLQNIVDDELALILQRNPKTKVKFMAVKPEANATDDAAMQNHLMLVLDYDNSVNKGITNIHKDENGGVIEVQGKKYLIIGTVGYNRGNLAKQNLYNTLFSKVVKEEGQGIIRKARKQYFDAHPTERFFVYDGFTTEVVPNSLIPGYIVKQTETDDAVIYRSVSELVKDSTRNPHNLDMKSLSWGIQEYTKFLVIGTSLDKVMVPRNSFSNAGNAFVLIPASNGKLIASYLKPLFNNEIREGKLKDRVYDTLLRVTAPEYNTRLAAVQELSRIFYFNPKEGDDILLGKDGTKRQSQVSFVKDGEVTRTFVIDSNFDNQAFLDAFAEMNPRVNVTADVLRTPALLREYDEAGALMTDVAKLGTAGSSYAIYAIDNQGNMIKPEAVNNEVTKTSYNSNYRNDSKKQVVYNQQFYIYDTDSGNYFLNGELVTDDNTIENLEYNRMVVEGELVPIKKDSKWNYYVINGNDNSEAIKIDRNTKEVVALTQEESNKLAEEIQAKKEAEARDEAAKEVLEKAIAEAPEVNLGIEEDVVIDSETGEMIFSSTSPEEVTVNEEEVREEETRPSTKSQNQRDFTHRDIAKPLDTVDSSSTQTFDKFITNSKYMMRVTSAIRSKWPSAPTKISSLKEFLREKNIEVDAIGVSNADMEAWVKTLEDCR